MKVAGKLAEFIKKVEIQKINNLTNTARSDHYSHFFKSSSGVTFYRNSTFNIIVSYSFKDKDKTS